MILQSYTSIETVDALGPVHHLLPDGGRLGDGHQAGNHQQADEGLDMRHGLSPELKYVLW